MPSALIGLGLSSPVFPSTITSVIISSSVTVIGYRAFYGCTSLSTVTFASGSQLTSIGYQAFCNCTSLTEIEIPSSVKGIGDNAFSDCTSLTKVTVIATTPPELGLEPFGTDCENREIYVPAEVYDDYCLADGWCDYVDIIFPILYE